jgi:hypothetical protein
LSIERDVDFLQDFGPLATRAENLRRRAMWFPWPLNIYFLIRAHRAQSEYDFEEKKAEVE